MQERKWVKLNLIIEPFVGGVQLYFLPSGAGYPRYTMIKPFYRLAERATWYRLYFTTRSDQQILKYLMPRLHITVLTTRNET